MTSTGIYRRLSQCSSPQETFAILALDHRDNLVTDLQRHAPQPITREDVVAFKRQVLHHLGAVCSAVLIDPTYGFPSLADGVIGGQVGLLAPLEVTNYTVHPSQRVTRMIPDWDAAKAQRNGCSGVKLLLYYHPEAANAASQTDLVDGIVEQCQRAQIPFFLEPVTYSLDPAQPLSNDERRQAVIESARHFSRRGVDVLKVEFPLDGETEPDERVWQDALRDLDDACTVPWALLSGGVSFELFLRQTALACMAGASGVIAGRAVWRDAAALWGEARETFLATTGRQRMARLAAVCAGLGAPWTARTPAPALGDNWYAS